MNKATYKASSDIALVKYWGKKDEVLRLPENGSVSMKLANLYTITTVEFSSEYESDSLIISGDIIDIESVEAKRVVKHLNRVRELAKQQGLEAFSWFAKVITNNSFPRATGLSSSGSGMTALTFSATKAIGLSLNEKELSILSRQASGTACRCSCGGFVEWLDGDTSDTSYSISLVDKDYWDVRSVIAIVDYGKKKISSTQGHKSAQSSILFKPRQKHIKEKIVLTKQCLKEKDFDKLGSLVEAEALEFHSILLTSQPPLVLWYPGTMQVIHEVQKMREEGISCYFTINTGFNIHVLTLPEFEQKVKERLSSLSLVKDILVSGVGDKPEYLTDHLF